MPALLITHDVDDVDHWLRSPKRQELMGPRGFTVRTFVDPAQPGRTGLVVEGATLDDFRKLMEDDATEEAMKHDGVHPDTLLVLEER